MTPGRLRATRAAGRTLGCWALLAGLLAFHVAAEAQVLSARIWPARDYTRLTLESKEEIQYSVFSVKDPERLVLDLEIEHHALGILDGEDRVLQLFLRFECEARVVARRPDAAGEDLGLGRRCKEGKEESQACPASEPASKRARRASPSNSSVICRSGGDSRPPAFSGHSTTQTESGLKCSRKPEFSHSVRSLKR